MLALLIFATASISGQAAPAPKSIHVVLDDNYPPYIFRGPDGRMQGILKDLWALWQQRTGIAVDFEPMEWGHARATMEGGQADVIDTIFETPERQKIYDFSHPYAKIEVPIFFSKEIGGITDVASVMGFTIGVKDGDACVSFLASHDINTLKYFPSYEALVQAAVEHRIRVLCIDKPPAFYLFNREDAADQFRYSPPLYTGEFHWAVAKGRTDLKQLVEDGFSRISADEREAIETHWTGQKLDHTRWPNVIRYGGYMLLVVALATLALLGWNWALRRRVHERARELSTTIMDLRQSEQRFHNFFELGHTGMAITSLEMGWLNVNPRLCEMFGYSRDEFAGMSWAEMTHPDDLEPELVRFRQLVAGEIDYYSIEKRFIHKNGGIIHAFLIVSCLRRQDRSVEYVLATIEDISERKLAQAKLQQLTQLYAALGESNHAIMRNSSEAELLPIICRNAVKLGGMKMAWVGMVDAAGRSVRPVACYGTGTEYLDGIDISLDPDSPTVGGPTATSIREGRPFWTQDFQHDPATAPWQERAAKYNWGASASLPLYRKGAIVGCIGLYSGEVNAFDEPMRELLVEMASDISFALDNHENMVERKQIERELQLHREHLEDLVDARTHELADANARLKDLDRLKSMFIASMSHELRTPMNSILGFTDLILHGHSGEINEMQRDQLQRVYGSGKHLLLLISDIIDLSKVEANKIAIMPSDFDLQELLDEVVQANRVIAVRKELGLILAQSGKGIVMHTDRQRLMQCMLNLVSNAIKYSKTGSVRVSAQLKDETVDIAVQDSGIGLSREEQTRLFQPFERIDSELSIKAGGTGLGLYLTKKLVTELLGGSITVDSQSGEGSCFTLHLPRCIKDKGGKV